MIFRFLLLDVPLSFTQDKRNMRRRANLERRTGTSSSIFGIVYCYARASGSLVCFRPSDIRGLIAAPLPFCIYLTSSE